MDSATAPKPGLEGKQPSRRFVGINVSTKNVTKCQRPGCGRKNLRVNSFCTGCVKGGWVYETEVEGKWWVGVDRYIVDRGKVAVVTKMSKTKPEEGFLSKMLDVSKSKDYIWIEQHVRKFLDEEVINRIGSESTETTGI